MSDSSPVLAALVDICGPDYARVARSVDTVAGRRARFVAVPATTGAVAATLRLAADHGITVLPRGSGSKIDWGAPPSEIDLIVDTARLGGMWHHDVQAGVAEVGTGTPVRAVQAALALRGQRLAVDPPAPTATVGGMLAVNEAGPLRHRFGNPADYVDRVAYVDLSGKVDESDGENGPVLAEITGLITSAQVRLVPRPAARRWVCLPAGTPQQARKLVERIEALELAPSAIEADLPGPKGPPGSLAVLLEGDVVAVGERSKLLVGECADAAIEPVAPQWWGRYPFDRADVAVRISVPAPDLAATIYALGDATGGLVPVRGSAGTGNVYAVLPGTLPADRLEGILDSMRHVLMARNGQIVIVAAPPALAAQVEMAGRAELF